MTIADSDITLFTAEKLEPIWADGSKRGAHSHTWRERMSASNAMGTRHLKVAIETSVAA